MNRCCIFRGGRRGIDNRSQFRQGIIENALNVLTSSHSRAHYRYSTWISQDAPSSISIYHPHG
jgi:hypothetical protein